MFKDLFKKYIKRGVHLFDIVIVFLFLFSAVTIFSVLFRTTKTVNITVRVDELDHYYSDQIVPIVWRTNLFYKGMSEKDALGKPQAEVVKVFKYDTLPENSATYLVIKLNSVYNRGKGLYTYGGKNVLVGNTIPFVLDGVMVNVEIISVEGITRKYPEKKLLITTLLRGTTETDDKGVLPYLADGIPQNETIKNTQGQIILKILKKEVYNSLQTGYSADGGLISSENPLRKDVYLTFEILVQEINNHYYFLDNIPVLIGKSIPVNFKKILINPVITEIKEIDDKR